MSDLYEKISFYKGLYKEIAVGFSEDKFLEKPIFIKHFTELENGDLDYKEFYQNGSWVQNIR